MSDTTNQFQSTEGRVASDSRRTAKYRQLQGWYLEHQLGIAEPGEGVGGRKVMSMLPKASVREQPDLNFLNSAAFEHAAQRIAEVPKERGSLAPDRLQRNMLSSMPLCFNIFGALRNSPGFPGLLESLFGCSIATLDSVVCEWAPKDGLGDRSAFDAAVSYTDTSGKRCLLGIETKYIEPFSQFAYEKDSYRQLHEACGWFTRGCDELIGKSTNQLFRTLLLAAACEASDNYDEVRVGLLTLSEDSRAAGVAKTLRASLHDPRRLMHSTYEQLHEVATGSQDEQIVQWARHFATRYLDPERANREPDADGPRFGKGLV